MMALQGKHLFPGKDQSEDEEKSRLLETIDPKGSRIFWNRDRGEENVKCQSSKEFLVFPAKAGIQVLNGSLPSQGRSLDSRLRGNDRL